MKKIRQLFLTLGGCLALIMVSVPFAAPAWADASTDQSRSEACAAINGTFSNGQCTTGGVSLESVVKTVLGILSAIIGIAGVIMIMVGGFKYITSGGDASKASGAKMTIIYAVIGLAIAALSQFIVKFVLKNTT